MRVLVAGGLKQPVLLDTSEATALLISSDDGKPNVIYRFLTNGEGWIRFTEGEDKNFAEAARELGLT